MSQNYKALARQTSDRIGLIRYRLIMARDRPYSRRQMVTEALGALRQLQEELEVVADTKWVVDKAKAKQGVVLTGLEQELPL